MESCIGPPDTRRWYPLGVSLDLDLNLYAKRNKNVGGLATKSFKDFLRVVVDEKNLKEVSGIYVVQKNGEIFDGVHGLVVEGISDATDYRKMFGKILYGFLKKPKIDDEYFKFTRNCWRVSRNVLMAPAVRFDFEKMDGLEDYENFIKYLREGADNEDSSDWMKRMF